MTTKTQKLSIVTVAALSMALFAGAAQARHSGLDGRLGVKNERMSPVKVFLDGDQVARLGPGERVTLDNVPNGVRLLQVRSRVGPELTAEVKVPVRGVARFEVAPLRGAALLNNRSGVEMKVKVDGRELGRVGSNRSLRSGPLRPGRHQVVARPTNAARGAPALRFEFHVAAGEVAPVEIGRWHAQLTVRNPAHRQANLFVDGQRMGRIDGDGRIVLARVQPGRHQVQLRRRGRVLAEATLDLSPGEAERWTPSLPNGQIVVRNDTRRPVRVRLDGRDAGSLAPGTARTLRDIEPGTHQVTIVRRNGREIVHQVRVARRASSEVVVQRPRDRGRPIAAR